MSYISKFGQHVGLQRGCSLESCILLSVVCLGSFMIANSSQLILSGRFIRFH